MGTPFQNVVVYPDYGDMSARIVWKMAPGLESGHFIVLKSPDGVNGWEEIGAVTDRSDLVDHNLLTGSKLTERYYRVVQERDDKSNQSDIVSTFGQVSRGEFCAARYIMALEYKDLRRFTRIAVLKLRLNGEPCPRCTDATTGQKVGSSLCLVCYGTGFEGGYYPGVSSFMKIVTTSEDVKLDRPDGAGTDDPVILKIRMMAFPILEKDDLLVDVKADRRVVIDSVDYSYLGGEIPIVAQVTGQLLRRSDVRYKIPITSHE